VALLALPFTRPLFAADGSPQLPFRSYTVLDGLTQSEVLNIDQDQAGYLWFTTARGLNRFDGKNFESFTIADGLLNNSLTAIVVSQEDRVWVGDAKGGITVINGARVEHTIDPLEGAASAVLDLDPFGSGVLAIVKDFGIVSVSKHGNTFDVRRLVADAAREFTGLEVFGEEVWAQSETGLYRLVFGDNPDVELIDESLRTAYFDPYGRLWAVGETGVVGLVKENAFDPLVHTGAEKDIVDVVMDLNDVVWVATGNELLSIESSNLDAEGFSATIKKYGGIDDVTSMHIDKENSIWLASESRLVRFLGDRFRHYRLSKQPDFQNVWSIAQDRYGRFWYGTKTQLLLRQADETLLRVGEDYGIPAGSVRDLVADRAGSLWVGMRESGLYRLDIDSMTAEHVGQTENLHLLDIDLAVDGAVWFSTVASGVWRYDPGDQSIHRFAAPDDTSVYTLDTAPDGSVWYGADAVGLVRLTPNDNGGYDESIIDAVGAAGQRLYKHIHLTGPSSAWVATEEGGIFLYENGKFEDFGAHSPLSDQTVYIVEPLDNGTVVVGGEQGLYQFTPGQAEFRHYNPQVGFIGMETNVHATLVDSEGFLWIGTVDGATQMNTTLPLAMQPQPTPAITRVETALDGVEIVDGQAVAPGNFGAHVEFAAISLLNPSGIQYSYRLIGAESDWGSPTTNRSVNYPRVPPGEYEFQVRARYSGGTWGAETVSHRFTVLPFFWQQPWFVFSTLLVTSLSLRAFMSYRTRKIAWDNEKLRAEVEERTRSINQARQKLEISNDRLSSEIEARTEIEARFTRAFENAPIGMGLLDASGVVIDGNPALKKMFWPESDTIPEVHFREKLRDDEREQFTVQYEKLIHSETDKLSEKLTCICHSGDELQTIANFSAVRAENGRFLYCVLQIQDLTESFKLTEKLEYQASYDELTGLLNRRAFESQLKKAWVNGTAAKKQSFLMFMDLDQFKVVNDTSGHSAGDQLLRAVSEVIEDNVRGNDVVGRLGGDEFGVVLWECPPDVALRIAEKIRVNIEDFRFHWGAETYRIGVSIGGLPVDPGVGDTTELQQLADAACYAAKEAGRNRVHMIDGDKDSARVHRGQVRWVQRIREAMDSNRFAIYAQPIRPTTENLDEPEHLEILLRLRDPETRRLIPPGAFLPAAERYGLSIELDKWVVRNLLDTLFVHSAFEAEQRSYWINLSGCSVGDKRFAEFLTDAISKSPLPRGMVNFEITETAVIRSVSEAGNLMAALQGMGCKFALDDFGSGLSSFGYLKKLPVDYIKIDGMFIRDLVNDKTDRIFVKSIIDIARTLNIRTIAEFVESPEIREIVAELGADYVQGFAVGRPFELAPCFPDTATNEAAVYQAKAG